MPEYLNLNVNRRENFEPRIYSNDLAFCTERDCLHVLYCYLLLLRSNIDSTKTSD